VDGKGPVEDSMAKLVRRVLILMVLGAVAYGVYAGFRARRKSGPDWTTVKVSRGDITEKALAVGQIEPRDQVHVKSKISGIVKHCFVEVGDVAKVGDPLFEIAPDPTPGELLNVDNRLRQAEATFAKARADYERGRSLNARGLLSDGDLDGLKEAFELARVALAEATANRELTRNGKVSTGGTRVETVIRAPAPGTVLTRLVNAGDPVVPLTSYQPGTDLATIADMGDLLFKGTVDEIDVGKIVVGMPCRITVGALPNATIRGKLARIAPQAVKNEGSTRFDVEIELDPGDSVTLRAGYSANADIVIREKKGVLLIPERLVSFGGGGKRATVEVPPKEPKGEPKKVGVKLGLSDGLNVEVLSGLSEGQEVVQRPPKEIS